MAYPVKVDLLTNDAYGNYGGRRDGSPRRVKPSLLFCGHITDNQNEDGGPHAQAERDYANRRGSRGPSAHDYIDPDGSVVHAIDHVRFAAWSNGTLNEPRTGLALVKTVLAGARNGYNPNELYAREVEFCGRRPGHPVTAAQLETAAHMIAEDAARLGIPISRATVGLHSDLDSVDRAGCPFPRRNRAELVRGLIARAREIAAPPPAPPRTYSQAELDAAVAEARGRGIIEGRELEWERQDAGAAVTLLPLEG